jgi:TetR/AcrR family transcriptional repressor of nem operon
VYPKGSFYYYFASKEQFGEELIKSYFREYLAALDELFLAEECSACERLLKYWQRWIATQSDACIDQECLLSSETLLSMVTINQNDF